jgi:hypothetical protein
MTSKGHAIGDPCPRCQKPLTRGEGMFYWRGQSADAAVCRPCSSMWALKGEEIPPLRPHPEKVQ